jgi:hypothetical protein
LNSVLTKTLEIASSFFRIFISFFQKIIKKLNSQAGLPKTDETGPNRFLQKNQSVFNWFFNPWWGETEIDRIRIGFSFLWVCHALSLNEKQTIFVDRVNRVSPSQRHDPLRPVGFAVADHPSPPTAGPLYYPLLFFLSR